MSNSVPEGVAKSFWEMISGRSILLLVYRGGARSDVTERVWRAVGKKKGGGCLDTGQGESLENGRANWQSALVVIVVPKALAQDVVVGLEADDAVRQPLAKFEVPVPLLVEIVLHGVSEYPGEQLCHHQRIVRDHRSHERMPVNS